MSITLTFTATHRAGNFARILTALGRLGLKPLGGTINKSADSRLDSIQMNLKAGYQVEPSTIKKLKEMVPSIVDIQVDSPSSTQAKAPPAPAPNSAEISSAKQATPKTAQPAQTSERPHFDDERLNFETKRLAGAYPDEMGSALKYVEAAVRLSQRQYILTQLGIRIGMYAARKRKAAEKDRGINRTVRSSLAMQKSHFGRVSPVIAAMMKKKAAKQSTSTQGKSQILLAELGRFLSVSSTGVEISVDNCPHCESQHSAQSPDCHFVAAFIESFIKDMWGDTKHSVTQTQSKATGASSCVFIVSGVKL